mgnify:CR=1 FL=1
MSILQDIFFVLTDRLHKSGKIEKSLAFPPFGLVEYLSVEIRIDIFHLQVLSFKLKF